MTLTALEMGLAMGADGLIPIELQQLGVHVQRVVAETRSRAAESRAHLASLDPMGRDGESWTPEEDALLGTDTDRAIAQKLRRSSVSVSNRRTKLGVSRKPKRRLA